jgi:hypothetical protein
VSRLNDYRVKSFLTALLVCACSYQEEPLVVPEPDPNMFAEQVYPILLRDCGFPACHGNTDRFFRVYGPGRTRLRAEGQDLLALDPPTDEEIAESYGRARSMLKGVHGVEDSLLIRKPMARSAGGAGHEGEDSWGRNVYQDPQDPAYVTIWKWALSAEVQERP